MFETQEVCTRPRRRPCWVWLLMVAPWHSWLHPCWECSPLCGHLTTLTRAEEEKKLGRGRDRHQIPIVKMGDKLFYGSIIQIMSGPSVLLRANWNTESQVEHRQMVQSGFSFEAWNSFSSCCFTLAQTVSLPASQGSQIASDDISLIF